MAKKAKKVRRNVVRGIAHIKATFNNTVTDWERTRYFERA